MDRRAGAPMSPTPTPPALADSVNLDEGWAILKACKGMLPVSINETADYAEILSAADGFAIAMTIQPSLIVYAVNNLPALLSRVAALQTALRDVIEGAIETGSADHCAHIARTALREPSDA